jgi:DNA-directed RNA polymerase alpha subunit
VKGVADAGGSHPVDRAGLHEILGYSGLATRIVNLLVRHGISTPSDLRAATYSDLLDFPGLGQMSLDHITTSLEYSNRAHKEGR